MADPLDALRQPVAPVAPDPAFAAELRRRLTAALPPTPEEEDMPEIVTRNELVRNGARHGDVSYISLSVPDVATARAFYGAVLGWTFVSESPGATARVEQVAPEIGLSSGPHENGTVRTGASLAFRVDDIAAATDLVRQAGGTADAVVTRPYGLESTCTDGQGLHFWLHQLPAAPDAVGENGEVEGDVSYIVVNAADRSRAMDFFTSVLRWRQEPAEHRDGMTVAGMAPMVGVGGDGPGITLCYRVDDIEAAVERVRRAGGTATDPERRPYGLESVCTDDQGIAFYLHQF